MRICTEEEDLTFQVPNLHASGSSSQSGQGGTRRGGIVTYPMAGIYPSNSVRDGLRELDNTDLCAGALEGDDGRRHGGGGCRVERGERKWEGNKTRQRTRRGIYTASGRQGLNGKVVDGPGDDGAHMTAGDSGGETHLIGWERGSSSRDRTDIDDESDMLLPLFLSEVVVVESILVAAYMRLDIVHTVLFNGSGGPLLASRYVVECSERKDLRS